MQPVEISKGELFKYRTQRVFVRCLRVLAGVGLFAITLWIGSAAYDAASTPFAAMSLLILCKAIGGSILALALLLSSYSSAFGDAPDEHHQILKNRLASALARERAVVAEKEAAAQEEKDRVAADLHWHGKPSWLRVVFDSRYLGSRPFFALAVFAAYLCILAGGLYLVARASSA